MTALLALEEGRRAHTVPGTTQFGAVAVTLPTVYVTHVGRVIAVGDAHTTRSAPVQLAYCCGRTRHGWVMVKRPAVMALPLQADTVGGSVGSAVTEGVGVCDGVTEGVTVGEAVMEGEGEGEGVRDGDMLGVSLGVPVWLGELVGVPVEVGVAEEVGVHEGVTLGVTVTEVVGEGVGVGVTVSDGDGEGDGVGTAGASRLSYGAGATPTTRRPGAAGDVHTTGTLSGDKTTAHSASPLATSRCSPAAVLHAATRYGANGRVMLAAGTRVHTGGDAKLVHTTFTRAPASGAAIHTTTPATPPPTSVEGYAATPAAASLALPLISVQLTLASSGSDATPAAYTALEPPAPPTTHATTPPTSPAAGSGRNAASRTGEVVFGQTAGPTATAGSYHTISRALRTAVDSVTTLPLPSWYAFRVRSAVPGEAPNHMAATAVVYDCGSHRAVPKLCPAATSTATCAPSARRYNSVLPYTVAAVPPTSVPAAVA